MSALGRRDEHDRFWFGLERINLTWTYTNSHVPSFSAVNWLVDEPGDSDEVAYFRSREGYSDDLFTRGSLNTHSGYSLCEYNCEK